MAIDFACSCGKHLHAPDGSSGKHARCPKCGDVLTVPDLVLDDLAAPAAEYSLPDTVPAARPTAAPAPAPIRTIHTPPDIPIASPSPRSTGATLSPPALAASYPSPRNSSVRRFAYVLLLLALIPLILSTFQTHESTLVKIVRSLLNHPDVAAQVDSMMESTKDGDEGVTADDILSLLPNQKLDDALLSRGSHAHWLMALAATVFYFSFLLIAFQNAFRYTKGLLFAGLFTGTVGVLLLLVFQWVAFHMPWFVPRSVVGMVLFVIKMIGYSYRMGDDPGNGFLLSFVGFTCGVGLCEEFCKAIPLLFRIKPTPGQEDPSWNSLLLWGLASGFGFGIAEGIMYSGRYYNGIGGAEIYYVRFLSCVALHAMWAGAVGVSVYRHQGDLLGADNNWTYFFRVVWIILIPMVLHGLYDTLLKKDLDAVALLVAVATFAYLAYQIETQRHAEPQAAAA